MVQCSVVVEDIQYCCCSQLGVEVMYMDRGWLQEIQKEFWNFFRLDIPLGIVAYILGRRDDYHSHSGMDKAF